MSDRYHVEFCGDHVRVELSPEYEFDPNGSHGVWAEIKRLCEEHGTRRVLVEGQLPKTDITTPEIIEAGERVATVPHLWLAFHVEDHLKNERSELFEKIAGIKGVRVKHFADREHALQWLRHNSPN